MHTEFLMLDGKVLYDLTTSVRFTTIHNAEGTALKECTVAERGILFEPGRHFLLCNTIPVRNY